MSQEHSLPVDCPEIAAILSQKLIDFLHDTVEIADREKIVALTVALSAFLVGLPLRDRERIGRVCASAIVRAMDSSGAA
jgi:hypothetical protein